MAGPTRSSRIRRAPRMTKTVPTVGRSRTNLEVALGGPLRRPLRPRPRPPAKPVTIPAPYPWATTRRARVRTMADLLLSGINTIKGDVQCERCLSQFQIEYHLQDKYNEVVTILTNSRTYDPPLIWTAPILPDCRFCDEKSCVKPIIGKKRSINWLFLFLGQTLGCCSFPQLRYFGKHNYAHRMGGKPMFLFTAYRLLREQLDGTY